jgi:protein-S-isoprenylcysteine O-methyltransferase Ste14
MSNGDRAIVGGSAVVLVGLFLPWQGYDLPALGDSMNGFHGWGLLTVLAWLLLVGLFVTRTYLHEAVTLPRMAVEDPVIYMVGAAVEFLGALAFSFDVPFGWSVRFGIFLTMIGALATGAGGYLKQSTRAEPPPA